MNIKTLEWLSTRSFASLVGLVAAKYSFFMNILSFIIFFVSFTHHNILILGYFYYSIHQVTLL